jgi:hypothetical protein
MQVASATATGIVGNAIEPMPMAGTMQQEDATHMIWLNLCTTTRRRRAAKMMFVFRGEKGLKGMKEREGVWALKGPIV